MRKIDRLRVLLTEMWWLLLPVVWVTAFALLLAGCSRMETVTEYVTVPLLPPEIMTTEVQAPSAARLRTNGDLIEYILELREALSAANAKLRAIGKWRFELTGTAGGV